MKNLRRWEIAALLALCIALCTGTWAQKRQAALASSLVRLHVLAVSDSDEEQAVKLKVRDAVLAYLDGRLEGISDPTQARQVLAGELEGIARAAESAAEGRGVSVTLTRESYPVREYEGFTLPAGVYDSLRVILGEGRGHNWWCVVFPPLCTGEAESADILAAMGEDNYALITGAEGYVFRFRILELWGEAMRALGVGCG